MDLSPAILPAAFAGGLFGAAIGGLPAFIFTGFAVLAGGALLGVMTTVAIGLSLNALCSPARA